MRHEKGCFYLGLAALNGGRIGNVPMRLGWLAGGDRTHLTRPVVAHRNNVVDRDFAVAAELVPRLRAQPRGIEAKPVEKAHSLRVNDAFRMAARAVTAKVW